MKIETFCLLLAGARTVANVPLGILLRDSPTNK
jgi:hypothetical protein